MTDDAAPPPGRTPRRGPARKQMLLRLDPAVHDALARWASDELRSANAQIEFLLRGAGGAQCHRAAVLGVAGAGLDGLPLEELGAG
ncbi:hypothetical protein AB0L54_33420, partial [Streptomyces sp. NPDC052196]